MEKKTGLLKWSLGGLFILAIAIENITRHNHQTDRYLWRVVTRPSLGGPRIAVVKTAGSNTSVRAQGCREVCCAFSEVTRGVMPLTLPPLEHIALTLLSGRPMKASQS